MGKKILIVDDDANALKEAETTLKNAGYETMILGDPKFIFKIIKSDQPDLILSDIIMPYHDGYSLCQELKKLYGDKIPIILATAKSYEQELIAKASKEFGANDFIIKPYKKEELLKKVDTVLKKSSPSKPEKK
ncbi:MAG: response regulator transcription factor [Candidatus Omnitrophica bacterium]|nr:response regulator transcription factor [Candidatus Omnitrophota bacterium]HOX53947.1 response regulator transcription factor [Candidatus Omnitrophota bacterium]